MHKYQRLDSFLTIVTALVRIFTAYAAIQVGLMALFNVNALPQPDKVPAKFAGLASVHNALVEAAWGLSVWTVVVGAVEVVLILGKEEGKK